MPHSLITASMLETILTLFPEDGLYPTPVKGLSIYRCSKEELQEPCLYEPAMNLILQGEKESMIGSDKFSYGAMDFIVNGVEVPAHSRVIQASAEVPLISLKVDIDKELVIQLASQIEPAASPAVSAHPGVSMCKVESEVLDVMGRLIKLLHKPEQAALMAPLLLRELTARVLIGAQGHILRSIYQQGSYSQQINQAILWLKNSFAQRFQVEELALRVNMATSTFHRQFKAMTSMSPLQYQKKLRLFEAQRLMLNDHLDANSASLKVGYESPQQFNREYKRLFGVSPLRNIRQLKQKT